MELAQVALSKAVTALIELACRACLARSTKTTATSARTIAHVNQLSRDTVAQCRQLRALSRRQKQVAAKSEQRRIEMQRRLERVSVNRTSTQAAPI